ncbi:MAG: tetratricopeptide repeat protein [Candidatus Sumerlaeaceae bacterium]|nr:tetratricopeptide repeat protein [Candidatus Sumerlaeaceae bacterium]
MNYFFSEEEIDFNSKLDPWDLLLKMGFQENQLYREGNTIRLFCPLHRDTIRRSMIIYTDKNTYKCQYTSCHGHKGGNLLEFFSAYMGVELADSMNHIRNMGTSGGDLIERADKLIQEGNLVDALPVLQKAVQLDPNNEISRCRLAALYLELGDRDQGYREYMTAAEHFGINGQLDKTLNIYNILIIITPDDVKVRKQLANLFSRLKRNDEAVAQLKWVVDRHIRKGDLGEASNICKKMIDLSPNYPESYRILGEILLKQGDYFNAVEQLKAATANYLREDNLKRAKETVDLGLKYTPGNPDMKDLKAKIERALELKDSAPNLLDASEGEYQHWLAELKRSVGIPEAGSAVAQSPTSAVRKTRRPTTEQPVSRIKSAKRRARKVIQEFAEYLPIPNISPDDPRIDFCLRNLKDKGPDELEALHAHLVGMFKDIQDSSRANVLSDFEYTVVREFYAAFCLALDARQTALEG